MHRLAFAFIASSCILMAAAPAGAQTMARASEQPPPSNSPTAEAAGNAPSTGLLTQADITGGARAAQVGLQAGDFFITGNRGSGFAKIYFRTTVPFTQDATATGRSSATGSPSGSGAEPETAATLNAATTLALLDPYGGLLNLSGGYWRQLGAAHARKADGTTGERLDNEGLFLDGRVGLKMINLPDQTADSATVGGTTVTPFVTSSIAIRYAHSVYTGDFKKAEGLFEASVAVLTNVAADTAVSSAFANHLLAKQTWALSLSIAFQLTGNLAVTITGSPTSSNGSAADLGKNYQVGVKLLNSSK
jgi:hypothetical protein